MKTALPLAAAASAAAAAAAASAASKASGCFPWKKEQGRALYGPIPVKTETFGEP